MGKISCPASPSSLRGELRPHLGRETVAANLVLRARSICTAPVQM